MDWLADQPGDTWQQRWVASGADTAGKRTGGSRCSPGTSGGASLWSDPFEQLRVCAPLLGCTDVIRPSLDWVLKPRHRQNLVPNMAKLRDPDGFSELVALCDASPAGRTMKARHCVARHDPAIRVERCVR